MATGYDNREPTRQSFAFQPAAPAQVRTAPRGASRGAQVVGGRSQGRGIEAGQQSDAGPVASGFGAYFSQLLEPHLQRVQRQRFFDGFTAAQSGAAMEDVEGSGIERIFGPTSYEEGAAFFTAQQRVDGWVLSQQEGLDELKRLTPAELSARLAETSGQMMTGNATADQLIQSRLMEVSGPLIQTVARARFAFQQTEAVRTQAEAAGTAATSLQALLVNQAGLGADGDVTAARAGVQSYLGALRQPEGMTDESYRGFLTDHFRSAMQGGNFHAVEAMKRSGFTGLLTDEELVRFEDTYLRYGNRAIRDATPTVMPDILALEADVTAGRVSVADAAGRMAAINNQLKTATGADIDLFDTDDMQGTARTITSAMVSALRRQEDRQWQVEDRDLRRQWDQEDREAEREEKSAQAETMWQLGAVNTAVAAGQSGSDFDVLAIRDYRAGKYGTVINAFNRERWRSNRLAEIMQAPLTSLTEAYTNDFGRAYDEWQAINRESGGAAAAYYGRYHPMMQRFHVLRQQGTPPQVAYSRSFGDPNRFSGPQISRERQHGLDDALNAAISSTESGWYNPWGRAHLNASGRAVVAGALRAGVAMSAQNSDLPTEAIVQQQLQAMEAGGLVERHGAFAYRKPDNARPLAAIVGLQRDELDDVFTNVVDARLKAAGFAAGAGAQNYDITRLPDRGGAAQLYIQAFDDEGGHTDVLISSDDIRTAATQRIERQRAPRRVTTPRRGNPL